MNLSLYPANLWFNNFETNFLYDIKHKSAYEKWFICL
jgi:hypothetical protein